MHCNPVLLFPNRHGGFEAAHRATTPLDRGGVQTTLFLSRRSLPSRIAARQPVPKCWHNALNAIIRSLYPIPVVIVTVRTASTMRGSNGWNVNSRNRCLPSIFLLTFTLPEEFRPLAWQHQRTLYALMLQCVWETVRIFSQNDKQLQGTPGAIAVLHTHSRRLDYHPHVHLVIPAAAIDAIKRLWRTKKGKGLSAYLFDHKALAKVFRAKMLEVIR